jgi:hypothetical protein
VNGATFRPKERFGFFPRLRHLPVIITMKIVLVL